MTATRTCRPALFVVSVLELTACVTLAFAGCASHTISDHRGVAPNGAPVPGYYGQTVRVVTGGLVETIQLDEDRPLNLQINGVLLITSILCSASGRGTPVGDSSAA